MIRCSFSRLNSGVGSTMLVVDIRRQTCIESFVSSTTGAHMVLPLNSVKMGNLFSCGRPQILQFLELQKPQVTGRKAPSEDYSMDQYCSGISDWWVNSKWANGRMSLHAFYRLLLARVLPIASRANANSSGQSERLVPPAPIRTPELSSRLNGQRRILFRQPRATTKPERYIVTSFRRLYFF